jgi:hypothetical protein
VGIGFASCNYFYFPEKSNPEGEAEPKTIHISEV